jgi:3-oxoacyl-[acyl-carrier-protein] synthase I
MVGPLYISCLGLICPVGLTPESAAAAMRAGISPFSELPYPDNDVEPVIGAITPSVPDDLRGRDRLTELLKRCFERFELRLPRDLEPGRLPLLLCTREPDRPGPRVTNIVSEIETRLGFVCRRDLSGHFARGSVAAFAALRQARHILSGSHAQGCLIAAVDSLIDAQVLHWLHQAKRLKTPSQSDGVIPGEAACLLLVTTSPLTQSHLKLRGLGFAIETATVLNEEPLLGKGMTAAIREALGEADLSMHDVDFRLSDVAGESYAFEELVLAQSRLMRQTREAQDLWHPAAFIGDCGAASGLVQLAWAEQAFTRAYAPGPMALAHSATATGDRAAALVCA